MRVLQISKAVPKAGYSTENLIDVFPCKLPESVRHNVLNLGVSNRYLISSPVSTSKQETLIGEDDLVELCVEACQDALEKTDISTKHIGCFIVCYDANPFLCPGLSQLLIRKIGFSPHIKHFNIQGMACASFTRSLELADDHLATRPHDSVLICISGVNSYWLISQLRGLKEVMGIHRIKLIKNDKKKRMELRKWIATIEFFLFGDGVAGVIVAKKGSGFLVDKVVDVTNLRKNDYMTGYARITDLHEPFKFGFYSYLDRKLPKLGVEYTASAIKRLLGKNAEATIKIAKKWAIHTGSRKILNLLSEHYNITHEALRESHRVLHEYGNLSGASLPFILEKIISENKFSTGDIVLMLGFGWGFTASACTLEFRNKED